MLLEMTRFSETDDATIGMIDVPNETSKVVTHYYTCEDEKRADKIAGETRIPAGTYDVRLRRAGGMVQRYNKRFAPFHDGMLHLQNVPNFEYIYIHVGNSDDDTEGCILVGKYLGPNMTVTQSAVAYSELYKKVYPFAEAGDLSISIRDSIAVPQ